MLTQKELKEFVSYDPETGIFRWVKASRPGCKVGAVVGYANGKGYRGGRIGGKVIYLHRAAWLYMTGSYPAHQIDHINGDRSDNRWVNLREATQHQNSGNMIKRSANKSGHKGVFWNKRHKKWGAQIRVNYKTKYLGLYFFKEDAAMAYAEAAKKHFGKFARVS